MRSNYAEDYVHYWNLLNKHDTLICCLTGRRAEVVELYYAKSYTVTKIADMLGVNKSTVSRTLKAARKMIDKRRAKE